ncbi:FkbM family methyltransferase [Pseudomonas sp. N2-11]|uniref:FkbM family methyltransferase n=1 Tax=Pseudomonas sp. N2-11 TaxID=2962038 RepID=UPI0020B7A814|nr:FkbM family methyltransferase [Pseudomonas sp. N2-11]MCP3788733.1 FkbM family methyltransferase [Pseudomonas sp. N2-11]
MKAQSSSVDDNVSNLCNDTVHSFALACGRHVPVCVSQAPLADAEDHIVVRHSEKLDVLAQLAQYPHVARLLEPDAELKQLSRQRHRVRDWLNEGFYIFGAFKVGLRVARQARTLGLEVKGFLDNDRAKSGQALEGLSIDHPAGMPLDNAVVVVASGRHANAIAGQLGAVPGIRLVNLHECLYALDGAGPGLGCEKFAAFVEAPLQAPWRYISAFLRLDDETSRRVFDGLMGMRIELSTLCAESVKSPWDDEYFDRTFVQPRHAARFVDAGAAAGDTLARLEAHFGPVHQAWVFEPELPAYYEALKRFCDRPEVWVFNMGLDEAPSRALYQPALSYDIAGELSSDIPSAITSFIQGVPLDGVVAGKVGLFKLDIEGMEASALRGARAIIERDQPVLAVCAYHRSDDYWKLIDQVQAIGQDYKVGIRLYADILEDITLYFYR